MKITALMRPTLSLRRRRSRLFRSLRFVLGLVPALLFATVVIDYVRLRVTSEGAVATLEKLQRQSARMRAEIDKLRVNPDDGKRLVARGQALTAVLVDPPVTVSIALDRLERAIPGPVSLNRLHLVADGTGLRVDLSGRAPGETQLRDCAAALGETAGLSVDVRQWVRSRDDARITFNAEGRVIP